MTKQSKTKVENARIARLHELRARELHLAAHVTVNRCDDIERDCAKQTPTFLPMVFIVSLVGTLTYIVALAIAEAIGGFIGAASGFTAGFILLFMFALIVEPAFNQVSKTRHAYLQLRARTAALRAEAQSEIDKGAF